MSKIDKEVIAVLKEAENKIRIPFSSLDVSKLREKLKLSRREFSVLYHINIQMLSKWEQGQRYPDSLSRAYLKCIQNNPELIRELVNK